MTRVSRKVSWRYLTKYLQKGVYDIWAAGGFPKGLRCYAVSILWKGGDRSRWEAWWRVREALLPSWFRRVIQRDEVIAWGRDRQGWWYVREGRARVFVKSPYRFMGRCVFDYALGRYIRIW
jgi:hypothetical protein